MVYALTSWLPKLMNNAGFSLGSSLQFLLVLNVGAIAGAIYGGWLGDRSNLPKVLTFFFIAAAVSITLMGLDIPSFVRYLAIAVAGAATIGSQILLYACAAQYYPLHIRSTGLGWASGIGRNGAIVGPLLGGYLLSEHHTFTSTLEFIGVWRRCGFSALQKGWRTARAPEGTSRSPRAQAQ